MPESDDADAAPPAVDADLPAFACEDWQSQFFDPCALPLDEVEALTLSAPGTYQYNTDNGVLLDPSGSLLSVATQSLSLNDGIPTRVLVAETLELSAGSTLRAVGEAPFVVATRSRIQVEGIIDVSSSRDGASEDKGAGANLGCPTAATMNGAENPTGGSGGSGGAGGSHGALGGTGGASAKDLDAVVQGGFPAVRTGPVLLAGGCQGGFGVGRVVETPNANDLGAPGSGGGAVLLASFDDVRVSGRISAGGAGGAPGPEWAGGGGGGSGGTIIIESARLRLLGSAILRANGGGGAGASTHPEDGITGFAGANALVGDNEPAGGGLGSPQHSAPGGAGGFGEAGSPGGVGEDSGGGGGGSTGLIRLLADDREVAVGASTVPSPSL